ncbi:hypothetical protein FDECE_2286 [Fusarium decemcellulare]|nr:hypothetical protein FDECE_2286 [Fusarium decemcellulare]
MPPSTSNLEDPRTTQPSQRHEKEEYFLEGESSTAKYDREMQQRWYIERARKRRLRLEAFSKYKQLIQAYAGRALTYERDILRTFEGVLEYFQGVLGPHIWGVPEDGFGEALLWQIEKPNSRRKGYPSWSCEVLIRRGISRPGETHRFQVVEAARGRWLADITLGPEWADWAQRNTKEVMFWELSRRDGRSINQGHGGFQNGRPRTSGYKYYFPDVVIVMAVMRDQDDVWQRVQVREIKKEEWEPLSSEDTGVFRLK